MNIILPSAAREAAHNLINLHLYPEITFRLGQVDRYAFHDAEVVLERTGNLYSSCKNALTYRYDIDGPGFSLSLLAIWDDHDQATADVRVVAITPESDDAREEVYEWLQKVADARMPSRDRFAGIRLS